MDVIPEFIDFEKALAAFPELHAEQRASRARLRTYGRQPQGTDPYWDLLSWRSEAAAAAGQCRGLGGLDSHFVIAASPKTTLPHDVDIHDKLPPAALLEALPYCRGDRRDGVVLAGGAVTSAVVPGTKPSDLDFFLIVPSTAADGTRRTNTERMRIAYGICTETLTAFATAPPPCTSAQCFLHFNSRTASYIVVQEPGRINPETAPAALCAQVVARLYETPAQVVHGFDLDACRLLYDGRDVWAALSALRALHSGYIVVEPDRQSPSYPHRLFKYCERYGLGLLSPGYQQAYEIVLQPAVNRMYQHLENSGEKPHWKWSNAGPISRALKYWRRRRSDKEDSGYVAHRQALLELRLMSGLCKLVFMKGLRDRGRKVQPVSDYSGRPFQLLVAISKLNTLRTCYTERSYTSLEEAYQPSFFTRRVQRESTPSTTVLRVGLSMLNFMLRQPQRQGPFSGSFEPTPHVDWYEDLLVAMDKAVGRPDSVRCLLHVKFGETSGEECPICHKHHCVMSIHTLPCGHEFGEECICKWYETCGRNRTCPVCRGGVSVWR